MKISDHDLNESIRTLALAIADLKNGYKFDDKLAPYKIKALEKALSCFEKLKPMADLSK